ncbi:MAG: hypothetical protein AAFZ80_09505 [Cyanobacteria bacterium P01_A01_bin.105]
MTLSRFSRRLKLLSVGPYLAIGVLGFSPAAAVSPPLPESPVLVAEKLPEAPESITAPATAEKPTGQRPNHETQADKAPTEKVGTADILRAKVPVGKVGPMENPKN